MPVVTIVLVKVVGGMLDGGGQLDSEGEGQHHQGGCQVGE